MELPVIYDSLSTKQKRLVREEYVRLQNGDCYHCGNDLNGPPREEILSRSIDMRLFPPGFLTWPVHLHHDHNTGLTLGAVHSYCNAVLWQYHDE